MHLISYFNTGSSCSNVQAQMKKSAEKCLQPAFTQASTKELVEFLLLKGHTSNTICVMYIFLHDPHLSK